jgi:hypothetical protein
MSTDDIAQLSTRFGGKWLVEGAPDDEIPQDPMTPLAAKRLIAEEMVLDGIPERNLATFVTTWMEPEAGEIIAESLDRNFIDHAEYPRTAEIEQRCIRMLANLFHAPGETSGARTQGSSEAIMLGALSLKWKWRERREAADKDTTKPNLVFGGDVHVVWEKFCTRSAPRTSSLTSTRTRSASRRSSARPSPATPTTSAGSTTSWSGSKTTGASTSRCTWMVPVGPSSGRSSTPTPSGTSGSSKCARSTPPDTSSGSSTPASAG